MIEFREEPGSNAVELVIDGRISKSEFDDIATKLEAAIARHGKVRLLEEVRSFGGVEPAMFWDDLRFSLRHLNDFSRCAIVAERSWMEWMAKILAPMLPGEVRHFPPERVDEARAWLRAGE